MPANWVAEVVRLPIAFAQVREDARLDQWVVERGASGAEVMMVASGGCSAAALAATGRVARLHLVDLNPAQIALARLKLSLLAKAEPAERLALLGHASMPVIERRNRLAAELRLLKLPADVLGPVDQVAESGPDLAGRYEILFAKLREAIGAATEDLAALLQLHEPSEQSKRAEPATPLGQALDAAFESVMDLPNLVGLFGEAATNNRCEAFSRHFARRTRHTLATLPAANNPYLWQMLMGQFPPGIAYPWLSAPIPRSLPEVRWTTTGMAEALAQHKERFDFVHLSNILDWLSPSEAISTLDLAWKALRPEGGIFVRQLNSTLDIRALGSGFAWEVGASSALHARDRSFFYRDLHLGKKQ